MSRLEDARTYPCAARGAHPQGLAAASATASACPRGTAADRAWSGVDLAGRHGIYGRRCRCRRCARPRTCQGHLDSPERHGVLASGPHPLRRRCSFGALDRVLVRSLAGFFVVFIHAVAERDPQPSRPGLAGFCLDRVHGWMRRDVRGRRRAALGVPSGGA